MIIIVIMIIMTAIIADRTMTGGVCHRGWSG